MEKRVANLKNDASPKQTRTGGQPGKQMREAQLKGREEGGRKGFSTPSPQRYKWMIQKKRGGRVVSNLNDDQITKRTEARTHRPSKARSVSEEGEKEGKGFSTPSPQKTQIPAFSKITKRGERANLNNDQR